MRASGQKTPQPTPSFTPQTDLVPLGTSHRLSGLRGQCLIRDHHRCVATRRFDESEAVSRSQRDGADAKDDDGRLLVQEEDDPTFLEVSHIIPHSLMSVNTRNETQLVGIYIQPNLISPLLLRMLTRRLKRARARNTCSESSTCSTRESHT